MSTSRRTLLCVGVLTLLGVLGGCASKGTGSYVVLLRDPDGNLGEVVVKTPQGEQVLSQVFRGAALDGSKAPFFVMQDQLKRDFGAAMAALPQPPSLMQPLLFPSRVVSVPPALQNQLVRVAETFLTAARSGRAPDISVVGHADSTGPADAKARADLNEKTGLQRANSVAEELIKLGVPREAISIEAHGDRRMLVPARPGGEEENRRVEITIR
jgi:outer membrane protein OmpA-like peptidoglycan-associated protein